MGVGASKRSSSRPPRQRLHGHLESNAAHALTPRRAPAHVFGLLLQPRCRVWLFGRRFYLAALAAGGFVGADLAAVEVITGSWYGYLADPLGIGCLAHRPTHVQLSIHAAVQGEELKNIREGTGIGNAQGPHYTR
jgi:hypothetical protein